MNFGKLMSINSVHNSHLEFGSLLIPCVCGENISVTLYDILALNEVKCSVCNTTLKINQEESQESITALRMFMDRVMKVKSYESTI